MNKLIIDHMVICYPYTAIKHIGQDGTSYSKWWVQWIQGPLSTGPGMAPVQTVLSVRLGQVMVQIPTTSQFCHKSSTFSTPCIHITNHPWEK